MDEHRGREAETGDPVHSHIDMGKETEAERDGEEEGRGWERETHTQETSSGNCKASRAPPGAPARPYMGGSQ